MLVVLLLNVIQRIVALEMKQKSIKKLIEKHGWNKYFNVDIMDSNGYIKFDVPNGKIIKENYVGASIKIMIQC